MKVMRRRPLVVDLRRARIQVRTGTAHLLDDPTRVAHEDIGVVDVLLLGVENHRRSANGMAEANTLNRDPMLRAETLVPLALERRTGIDEREIDVEEDRGRPPGRRRSAHWREPEYGPATTTA